MSHRSTNAPHNTVNLFRHSQDGRFFNGIGHGVHNGICIDQLLQGELKPVIVIPKLRDAEGKHTQNAQVSSKFCQIEDQRQTP